MRTKCTAIALILFSAVACMEGDVSLDSGTGTGGSLTRFAIQGNVMYVASNSSINVYDIAANTFAFIKEVTVGFALETIVAKGEFLYLGAQDAMYIYSLAQPTNPTFVFRYSHITSCDPVVVQGNRAYVTLSSGSMCNLGTNALEIIDISNPKAPALLANYPMTSPGGLAIDGGCLFVCEGKNGLKMLNVADPLKITEVNKLSNINAYDVIALRGILTLTGEDGIFQFQYDCARRTLQQLSKIPVQREAF
jgi:hypothetical protein